MSTRTGLLQCTTSTEGFRGVLHFYIKGVICKGLLSTLTVSIESRFSKEGMCQTAVSRPESERPVKSQARGFRLIREEQTKATIVDRRSHSDR